MAKELIVDNLHVSSSNSKILKGVSLKLKRGELVVLMGPNGSGKTTLTNTLMGHPGYKITQGDIKLDKKNIKDLQPYERAKLGLFLAFQAPPSIQGVSISQFLRTAYNKIKKEPLGVRQARSLFIKKAKEIGLKKEILERDVNNNFSGGEKKRTEILELITLRPQFAVLDEVDSGLDIDGLKNLADILGLLLKEKVGILYITHHLRVLDFITPHKVAILINGSIAREGDKSVLLKIEKEGYGSFK